MWLQITPLCVSVCDVCTWNDNIISANSVLYKMYVLKHRTDTNIQRETATCDTVYMALSHVKYISKSFTL